VPAESVPDIGILIERRSKRFFKSSTMSKAAFNEDLTLNGLIYAYLMKTDASLAGVFQKKTKAVSKSTN